ncbi:MAG: hypothetical protein ACXAC7_16950, partial [Candidatus Hodarchaeales archaeon]
MNRIGLLPSKIFLILTFVLELFGWFFFFSSQEMLMWRNYTFQYTVFNYLFSFFSGMFLITFPFFILILLGLVLYIFSLLQWSKFIPSISSSDQRGRISVKTIANFFFVIGFGWILVTFLIFLFYREGIVVFPVIFFGLFVFVFSYSVLVNQDFWDLFSRLASFKEEFKFLGMGGLMYLLFSKYNSLKGSYIFEGFPLVLNGCLLILIADSLRIGHKYLFNYHRIKFFELIRSIISFVFLIFFLM